ncbi:hypothetical protein AKA01nite_16260 [Alkalibacterium kapii]|uniref:NERD domain-containing protein n=2 Tax=Alkalibacterium kapii TaxID=426704 RepID=A0A511AV26_9LACT|nr:hypothetical protein AKA01nite_16260 [Alkalibacterium kapii]
MYQNQVKGFEGEQLFDEIMQFRHLRGLVINDLLIDTQETFYQIDSLLVTSDRIYLYEVKNYTGSYYYKDGGIYSNSGHALQDPIAQAERKRAYLYNLLLNLNLEREISAYVVFVNPDFYVYNFPEQNNVIFKGQLANHFKSVSETIKSDTSNSKRIAEKLIALHDDSYRSVNLPGNYAFDQLKKGIICSKCGSFQYETTRQTRVCTDCFRKENISAAIHRSIEEFRLLFPTSRLDKNIISLWCENNLSKSRIQAVLRKNYCLKSCGRGTYYV